MADEGQLSLKELQERFKDIYDEDIEEDQLKTDLNDLVTVTEEEDTEGSEDEKETQVQLVPLQLCGVRIQNLLKSHGDKMLMSEFEVIFFILPREQKEVYTLQIFHLTGVPFHHNHLLFNLLPSYSSSIQMCPSQEPYERPRSRMNWA